MNQREAAAKAVTEIIDRQKPAHIVVADMLERNPEWKPEERAFAKRLTEGTVERLFALDAVLSEVSSTKLTKMKPLVRNILRCGVYQLYYMEAVPDSAVCNEAVKLVKKNGLSGLGGFVNAVLRNAARSRDRKLKDSKPETASDNDDLAALELETSTPVWLLKQWARDYGKDTAERISRAQFDENPLTVRCNLSRITPEELLNRLTADGAEAEPAKYCPYAFYLKGCGKLTELSSFREGLFQIQDISSVLVGISAGIKGGECILDLCAAPGGKTLHLADLLAFYSDGKNPGFIEARDVSEQKLSLIKDNLKRSRLGQVSVVLADATVLTPKWQDAADVVIADVPCSGTGVIGRKPDIKYNMSEEKQKALIALQHEILKNAVCYVKPGGTLIFSTCTLNKEENDGGREFLMKLGMKPGSLVPYLGEVLKEPTLSEGYLQLVPGIHGTDGFYLSRFQKPRS